MSQTNKKKAASKSKPRPKPPQVDEPLFQTHDQSSRVPITIRNGTAIIGGDGHYVPFSPPPVAHRAFVKFAKTFPGLQLVCYNGDSLDLAQCSRHSRIGWETLPTVQQELEEAQARLHEIELAAPRGCALTYTYSNHDIRFETKLANDVPQYQGVKGFRLRDHLGNRWQWGWATWINGGDVVIKHRWKGGIHAPWNNALHSGRNIVSNHLHSLKVYPVTDYSGTRFGVDTGMLGEPFGSQFENYTEDNARNWRAGFVVCTWINGKLLWPEVVAVVDQNHVQFRGELVRV